MRLSSTVEVTRKIFLKKRSLMGLKMKSACLFGESGNPSIASNIFVFTRSIKIIIAPPRQLRGPTNLILIDWLIDFFYAFTWFSHCALTKARLMSSYDKYLTQWSTVEMLWVICKCRSSKKNEIDKFSYFTEAFCFIIWQNDLIMPPSPLTVEGSNN